MNFQGKAKRLDDIDLPREGAALGIGEDEVHAVLDVESAGTGFDSKGRPKMLFEPHIFYRLLGAGRRAMALYGLGWRIAVGSVTIRATVTHDWRRLWR